MRRALPLVVLVACSSEDGEVGALERALSKARPMHEVIDETAAAGSAWDTSVPLVELIDHRLEVEAKLELSIAGSASRDVATSIAGSASRDVATSVAEQRHTLVISRSIARQGRRFRVVENRVHSEPSLADPAATRDTHARFEAIFDGQHLAIKRGNGPFIERDARDGLPARILSQLHDLTPSLFTAFGDYLVETPSPGRAPEIAGLGLEWRALSLDVGVRPRTMSDIELNALKDHDRHAFAWVAATFRPTKVVGRVGRVAQAKSASDRILECDVSLAGGFRGPEGGGGFTLEVTQRVSRLADSAIASLTERAPADFVLPADRLPADRPRPWKMIEDVLGAELLPPYVTR